MLGKLLGKVVAEVVLLPVTVTSEAVKAADESVKHGERIVSKRLG
jgi:hypothetical protein